MSATLCSAQHVPDQSFRRYFALCESCLWLATILGLPDGYKLECPACRGTLSMLPLTTDESYTVRLNSSGIEMAFARKGKIANN